MASDMGGLVQAGRFRNTMPSSFPTPAYSRTKGDIRGLPSYTQDPYFSKTSLLLYFDGVNGSTATADYSPINVPITFSGAAAISSAVSAFGGSSLALGGSGDYISTPHNSRLSANTDYTIEAYVFPRSNTSIQMIASKRSSTTNGEYFFLMTSSGLLAMNAFDASATAIASVTGVTPISANTLHHVALCRYGNSFFLLLDGSLEGIGTLSASYTTNTSALYIGHQEGNSTRDWNGYIDSVRVTYGTARYLSNYALPETDFPSF